MKTNRLLVVAGVSLALAFTFSCSSSGDEEGNKGSPDNGNSSSGIDCPIDGYRTVEINGQTWMAENLNCKVIGSKCYGEDGQILVGYDEETHKEILITLSPAEVQANCEKYGRLYDWWTAKKVCPSGWRLPSNEDWDKLYSFAEDGECEHYSEPNAILNLGHCPTAGKHLKATSGWNDYEGNSGNGEDTHGFSALPGGGGGLDMPIGFLFQAVGYVGAWWSSSEYDANYHRAYYSEFYYYDGVVVWTSSGKGMLLSVRCVKN